MSEERRVIKMQTLLALVAGKDDGEVSDLLGFLTQRELSATEEEVVKPLVRAWVLNQKPELMNVTINEGDIFEEWAEKQEKQLGGGSVSIPPIPENEMTPVSVVLDTMQNQARVNAEQAATIKGLEAKVEELEPFPGTCSGLESKVEQLEGKVESLEAEKAELQSQVSEFSGKLPVAEDELNTTIKDIVTKALKDAVAAVPVGAAAGAAAAGAGEANAAVEPEEESGGVPDDFGFGASGSDNDGFGF